MIAPEFDPIRLMTESLTQSTPTRERERTMRFKSIAVGLLVVTVNLFAADEHAAWTYAGDTGPAHWGDIGKDNGTCKLGKEQSPVDITGAKKTDLPPIAFAYTSGPAEIVNNGHTVQINLSSGGSIRAGGVEYKVVQFHFHTPSEEKINGKAHAMVAHLVHKSADGTLAVVAVEIDKGKENPALQAVFAAMPAKAGETRPLAGGVDLTSILPANRGYYAFMGSLTTPPCTEGVHWFVLKDPVDVSAGQLAVFAKLYPMNARPVQPVNGRSIEETR